MSKKENHDENFMYIFLKIAALLIILSIAFPFIVNYFFSDWTKSGTFGDTFGALNALFSGLAFTGVIVTILIQRTELRNQRIELSLQRSEMQETRKEFLLNRTTTLVYNQLDRFEKALGEFIIKNNGATYIGNDALSFLSENKELGNKPLDKPEDEYRSEMKNSIIILLKIYIPNKTQIEKCAHNTYNSVEVLKRLIYKTELEVQELNDLKNLFFVNIGFVNMKVIKQLSKVSVDEFEYLTTEDYDENNLEVGQLTRANIFLKSIIKFEQLRLTKENFAENKAKWEESIGNNI